MTRLLVLLVLVASFVEPAHAQLGPPGVQEEPPKRTPFDRGRFGLTGGAGFGRVNGERYYTIGLGGTYFVLDGVGLDASAQVQWGDGPTVLRTTPGLRYVAQPLVGHSPVIPYVGVFYSHFFVAEPFLDVDAIGTRGGLLYVSGSIILGLGVVYERIVSECTLDCSSVYPDFTISIAL